MIYLVLWYFAYFSLTITLVVFPEQLPFGLLEKFVVFCTNFNSRFRCPFASLGTYFYNRVHVDFVVDLPTFKL